MHGFALLNMTRKELAAVALKDPFMRYYTVGYLGMVQANNAIFKKYNNLSLGEINHISEYLPLTAYFQKAPEKVLGVNTGFLSLIYNQQNYPGRAELLRLQLASLFTSPNEDRTRESGGNRA